MRIRKPRRFPQRVGLRSPILTIFAVGLAFAGSFAMPGQAAEISLQPHQAHYELTTIDVRMPGATAAGPGQFIVRLQKRCTGWVLLTQLTLGLSMGNGQILEIQSTGSSEESLDGKHLTFQSEVRMNDELFESLEGTATRGQDGSGTVEITKPDSNTLPLPPGTLFSVSAFHDTVTKIMSGEKIVNYILFDGSTPEPIRGTDVVVGPAKPLATKPDGDTALIGGTGWQVITSFYGLHDTDAQPLVTNTAHVYANGVTSQLSLDVGLAGTEGVLTLLQALPEPSC